MLELVQTLDEPHVTATRVMTRISARCTRCGEVSVILLQNFRKHNRLGRAHCSLCIGHTFHRMTGTRIYRIWHGMRARVLNPSDKSYKHYGGRGISLCDEWNRFENFYADMRRGYAADLTLERKDVNGHYCLENCVWATNMQQQSNKRSNRRITYQGERMHLAEFSRRTGFGRAMLVVRLNEGMSPEGAVQSCRASTYGTGRNATKGRNLRRPMFTTSSTAAPAAGS